MTIRFDPIDYVQQLEAAGVPKAQAGVHAKTLVHLVSSCVAHPGDLIKLEDPIRQQINLIRQEISALEERVSLKFESLEERITLRFKSLEERITLRFESLDIKLTGQIHALDARLTGQIKQLRWMLNTVLVMNIALVAKIFIP